MNSKSYFEKAMMCVTHTIYILASLALTIISFSNIIYSLYSLFSAFFLKTEPFQITMVLETVSLIVISLAVFDVAKFFFEEEVILGRKSITFNDVRITLSKFMVIISIAVFLEALVSTFIASKSDIRLLIYPAALFGAAFLLVLGLGLLQRLSGKRDQSVKITE